MITNLEESDEESDEDKDPNLRALESIHRDDDMHQNIQTEILREVAQQKMTISNLANNIRSHNVTYWSLLMLIISYEGWICLNAGIVYFFKLGSCSSEFSLAFYHFNELSHGVGYGVCSIPVEYTPYIILASILTNLFVIMIILELVGHLLEVQLKYGDKMALIVHVCSIGVLIMFFFFFTVLDICLHGRGFLDASYYVWSTAYTTGDKGPWGFYRSPDMTKSTGLVFDRILNIIAVQVLTLAFEYCIGVVAHWIWSQVIKQQNLTHLEVKRDIMEIRELAQMNGLRSQTIISDDIFEV